MKKVLPIVLLLLVLLPVQVSAASAGGLVTCDGPDCNFCNLSQMVQGVIQWIFLIIIPVGILVFAFAGFRMIFSRGDMTAAKDAKRLLIGAIIGLVIMFAAWTIVDSILKLATGSDLGVWNPISCGTQNPAGSATSVDSAVAAAGSNTGNSGYQGVVNGGTTGATVGNTGVVPVAPVPARCDLLQGSPDTYADCTTQIAACGGQQFAHVDRTNDYEWFVTCISPTSGAQ